MNNLHEQSSCRGQNWNFFYIFASIKFLVKAFIFIWYGLVKFSILHILIIHFIWTYCKTRFKIYNFSHYDVIPFFIFEQKILYFFLYRRKCRYRRKWLISPLFFGKKLSAIYGASPCYYIFIYHFQSFYMNEIYLNWVYLLYKILNIYFHWLQYWSHDRTFIPLRLSIESRWLFSSLVRSRRSDIRLLLKDIS